MSGTDPCKLLVEKVQSRLRLERMAKKKLIDNSRRAIAENFRLNNNVQDALKFAGAIIKDNRCIRAFDLIESSCKVINDNMSSLFSRRSDNGESLQNHVDDAISSLVYLASVLVEFHELGNLGKHLKTHIRGRSESDSRNKEELRGLLTNSADDDEKLKILQEIANYYGLSEAMEDLRRKWNLERGTVSVKKFNKYRITFQTLLFISEVMSYVLDWTANHNIRILVAILVLSATCCLSINIPLILRWWRERSVRFISQIGWVESSFSIFLLGADILKVGGHDKAGTKVMETWFVVFAAIVYVRLLLKECECGWWKIHED